MKYLFLLSVLFVIPLFAQQDEKKQKPIDTAKNISIEDLKLKTGEAGQGEAPEYEITGVKEVGRRFIPEYKKEREVALKDCMFYDVTGKRVPILLDRVVLLEYWTKNTVKNNLYWEKVRALEEKYKEDPRFKVISIYHDASLFKNDQIPAKINELRQFKMPLSENLLFDIEEILREKVHLEGPSFYILIDHRQQATHGGRGDFETTQTVFDSIENALKNIEKDGYKPNGRN
ncbi:MAG: hypothetical protein CSA81_07635 [Acidobacteria bacterium]|nr:MAG: hypothetical protein CSA81_07635 [Acidobacteriota bacterium]